MTPDALKMINLMFREDEHFCISNSKYGYMSLPIKIVRGKIPLVSNNSSIPVQYVDSSEIIFVALNPMKEKAYRRDSECAKFRNFLIELDTYERQLQIEYIKRLGLPYSAMIWSGSKSVHVLISLEGDGVPNEKIYRFIYKWILNVAPLSDQALGNASRSIRLCGAIRPETGLEQELIELKGPVKIEDLMDWLKKHPDCKPKQYKKRETNGTGDISSVPTWVAKLLKEAKNGFNNHFGRNKNWFILAKEFKKAGFDQDKVEEIFQQYFQEESDFKEKEMLITIKSAFESEE